MSRSSEDVCVGFCGLEIYTELNGECMAVCCVEMVFGDVCNTELVGEFEVEVIVLSSATYLDTHIGVLVGME